MPRHIPDKDISDVIMLFEQEGLWTEDMTRCKDGA